MHLDPLSFDSSRAAALSQISKIEPNEYARTRNFIDGKVTRLSPWLTHGWTDTLEVAKLVNRTHRLSFDHKLVFELGWREFFKHVHRHLGDAILTDVKDPFYGGKYSHHLPDDVLQARTGVKPIDEAVKTLYSTGYIHNHARMWLASYVVHIRKTHWRAGADWMYAYLLDGDLASNYLSWQWVAGTFSNKPYLFNAENVQKFAPSWSCPNTQVDTSYERLHVIATQLRDLGVEKNAPSEAAEPPALQGIPLNKLPKATLDLRDPSSTNHHLINPQANCRIVHPWNLSESDRTREELSIGILDSHFHDQFKWSERRWSYVLDGLKNCDQLVLIDSKFAKPFEQMLSTHKGKLSTTANLNPGYQFLSSMRSVEAKEPTTILPTMQNKFCSSFSKFYKTGIKYSEDLQSILDAESFKSDK